MNMSQLDRPSEKAKYHYWSHCRDNELERLPFFYR